MHSCSSATERDQAGGLRHTLAAGSGRAVDARAPSQGAGRCCRRAISRVNSDCGLKTRHWPETRAGPANMVAAARAMRKEAPNRMKASAPKSAGRVGSKEQVPDFRYVLGQKIMHGECCGFVSGNLIFPHGRHEFLSLAAGERRPYRDLQGNWKRKGDCDDETALSEPRGAARARACRTPCARGRDRPAAQGRCIGTQVNCRAGRQGLGRKSGAPCVEVRGVSLRGPAKCCKRLRALGTGTENELNRLVSPSEQIRSLLLLNA